MNQQLGLFQNSVHSPENQSEFTPGNLKENEQNPLVKRKRTEAIRDPALIDMKINDAGSVDEIFAICARDIEQFNSVNTATACARLATLGRDTFTEHPIMERLAEIAVANISKFEPGELSDIASAFTEFYLGSKEEQEALFDALSIEAQRKIASLDTHDISRIADAFAELGIRDEALFNALAIQATQRINDFSNANLANTARAFAQLAIHNPLLFNALAAQFELRIQNFSAADFANIVWAFAELNIRHEPLSDALAIQATQRINDFSTADFANIVWAFAELNIRNEALFEALSHQATQRIQDFSEENLANIARTSNDLAYEMKRLVQFSVCNRYKTSARKIWHKQPGTSH